MQKENKPYNFNKRIGNTLYNVEVYFDETSRETYEDKIIRLIKNGLTYTKEKDIMMIPQTDGLLERSS